MVATSNIHYNLAAWSNATYVLAARRSNAGNAYQCITAGTSTVAPTGTAADTAPGGTAHWKWLSAITYVSLATWAAALPTTLTQPVVALLWNNGTVTPTSGTALLTLSGHTTTSTNTITVGCAPGESFRDSLAGGGTALAFGTASGVSVSLPGTVSATHYIVVSDANVFFDGIQFKDPLATSTSVMMEAAAGLSLVTLRNCLFDAACQNPNGLLIGNTGGYQAFNCLFVDRQSMTAAGYIFNLYQGHNTILVNCTVVAVGDTGTGIGGNMLTDNTGANTTGLAVKNCIFIGYGSTFFIASGNSPVAVDHCVFSTSTAYGSSTAAAVTDGGGNLYSKTAAAQFVSATIDFRLKTGSAALDTGTPDTGHIASADDIIRTSRPQGSAWDIGCFELLVAVLTRPQLIWMD